jgi:hypothetical protein
VPSDASIDWGAAASAYEYYFACIWRYATKYNVTHYMMLNEPPGDEKTVRQVGVLARMARLALEDVRAKVPDAKTSSALCLSGPACYMNWEEFWPYVEPYVDFLDVHLYEPDPDLFARKLSRALTHARLSGRRTLLTEFNRVGGPMPPEESLFGMRPSLQVAGLLMAALQGARPGDPGLEAALLYQFQFPATHRNFKSLVYGDMNLVDWTGQDKALRKGKEAAPPAFEALQLRFATPAYHMLKMAARCVPDNRDRGWRGSRPRQPSKCVPRARTEHILRERRRRHTGAYLGGGRRRTLDRVGGKSGTRDREGRGLRSRSAEGALCDSRGARDLTEKTR